MADKVEAPQGAERRALVQAIKRSKLELADNVEALEACKEGVAGRKENPVLLGHLPLLAWAAGLPPAGDPERCVVAFGQGGAVLAATRTAG